MLNLEIAQIPLLTDNYAYLLIDHKTGQTAVVDPSEADPILRILERRNLKLHYILNTHHHFDHVGGNLELKEATGCTIICSHTDKPRIDGADQGVAEGEEVSIGSSKAIVMEIPGHTVGHIAFYFREYHAVFSGDTMFSLGCGRLFEGTPEQMWNSLRRLADLPPETKVYCGHEYTEANGRFALAMDPHNHALQDYCHHVADRRRDGLSTVPSTIEIEAEANPFLRAPMLIKALGLSDSTLPHEAFAEMRMRKDNFKA
jgi:hydroxyacylglutathione hydrolase